jgi:hypothetical protein
LDGYVEGLAGKKRAPAVKWYKINKYKIYMIIH